MEVQLLDFFVDGSSSLYRRSVVILLKRMLSIDQGWITTSRDSGVSAIIQFFTVECCYVHCAILDKFKIVNYPFEIPSDHTQHELSSETILFNDNLCRSMLGSGLDHSHILPVGGVTIKYPQQQQQQQQQ